MLLGAAVNSPLQHPLWVTHSDTWAVVKFKLSVKMVTPTNYVAFSAELYLVSISAWQ
jgi:hypothetical protein